MLEEELAFRHAFQREGAYAMLTEIRRAHRDGQVCSWSLLFAAGTVEEQAARIMINRLIVTSASVDGDLGAFGKLARLFDADWLPESRFDVHIPRKCTHSWVSTLVNRRRAY